jgi:predicted exporter
VPVSGLPDGLRQVAEYNPVSCWAAAVRTLFGNPTALPSNAAWPLEHAVVAGLIWCVATSRSSSRSPCAPSASARRAEFSAHSARRPGRRA